MTLGRTQAEAYLSALQPWPSVLEAIRRAPQRKGDMSLSDAQVRLLMWLGRVLNVQDYLEIGVYTGFSSTAMALSLPETATLTLCDISVTYTDIAQAHWQVAGVAHKMRLQVQPALITLKQLPQTPQFDLALIDADKRPTEAYFEACLPLMRTGGVIALDNILLNGRVTQSEQNSASIKAMRGFIEKCANDARVTVLFLPLGDGLALLQKNKEIHANP